MANDGKATGSAPEEQGSLEIAERSVQIAAGSPGMVTPAAGSPSKKLIQLLYEYFGIFMVTFALLQTVVGTHLEQASKDRARGDVLKEHLPHAVGQSGCHSPEENRPCGWKPEILAFAVILTLANHGVMMWWFYKIWKHVTAPYGTLGYVIQAAEVKREPYFKKFIIYTMAFLLFAMACMLIIPAMDGGEVQGGMIISCFLVFGSISPFWVTVGSKVPLSKTCYDIPIRKLERPPFAKRTTSFPSLKMASLRWRLWLLRASRWKWQAHYSRTN